VNFIFSTFSNTATSQVAYHIEEWRRQRHIVELMPIERLTSYLRFDPASALALVDAIILGADTNVIAFANGYYQPAFPLARAVEVAENVRSLPEQCAMRDGRKWRSVPLIIFTTAADSLPPYYEIPDGVYVLPPVFSRHPSLSLSRIREHVDEYHDRILSDYVSLGMLVRFDSGHVQIGPALKKKDPTAESAYYYAKADRRSNRDWVTVKRDREGLSRDVAMFHHLLETCASETVMHRFFEQHPAFLMEALLGIPLSHRPVFASPRGFTPDYSLLPILGPVNNSVVELLELKGPGEAALTGRLHRGFASKVHRAVDQVRDYDRYLRDPANAEAAVAAFGYLPDDSRLAVLIGRMPRGNDYDVFSRRRSEVGVRIVTYDEVLEIQASQMTSMR
jgi:hypothetical protein